MPTCPSASGGEPKVNVQKPQGLLKHFDSGWWLVSEHLNVSKHSGAQWRAQLHLHEHQAGLCAHRHEGDGLHRVDPGDPQQDGEKEETHCIVFSLDEYFWEITWNISKQLKLLVKGRFERMCP